MLPVLWCITLYFYCQASLCLGCCFLQLLFWCWCNIMLTAITTTTTTILQTFVWNYPGELVPEEAFTHSHLSWSLIILYLLPPSTAIHGILPVQFTCLTVFLHNLCPSFLWSTSWSGTLHFVLHTFFHPIILLIITGRLTWCCFIESEYLRPRGTIYRVGKQITGWVRMRLNHVFLGGPKHTILSLSGRGMSLV